MPTGSPRSPLTPEQKAHRLALKQTKYRDPAYLKQCPTCKQ